MPLLPEPFLRSLAEKLCPYLMGRQHGHRHFPLRRLPGQSYALTAMRVAD